MKKISLAIIAILLNCANVSNVISTKINVELKDKISNSLELCQFHDSIIQNIEQNKQFDIDNVIQRLQNQLIITQGFCGLNGVHYNNISIRHYLLLSALYLLKNDSTNSNITYLKAKELLIYNTVDDSVYSEGSSYLVYVIEMINMFLKIRNDEFLVSFKEKGMIWINKFSHNTILPPVGDTRVGINNYIFNESTKTEYDNEETCFRQNNNYLFIRHPKNINKYNNSGHIHFDL
jgi:hypothetical protein